MADEAAAWQPDPGLLAGRTALIAGGAQGIGEATTRLLAAAGAAVAVADYDGERAEAVTGNIAASGGTGVPLVVDLRDRDACAAVVDRAVDALGTIDILANVAGGMSKHAEWKPLIEWDDDAWDAIVHLNLRYVFWLCRAVIPRMQERGTGAIVNVASIAGVFGAPDQSAYGAAKAGLINLTKTLALECGPSGIRVNAVSPGVTLTEAALAAMPEDTRAPLVASTPLRRLTRPVDIAKAVLFFCSPMAESVSGQMLLVDGGISASFPYATLHGPR
jgi:NAD(P)-dependent dehydrogenase (short-subunit alcohol dehydrogenase family)